MEPQRDVWIIKMSWPSWSPIVSAMRWNVDRGTTIRRRQNLLWASLMKPAYLERHRCMPVKHISIVHSTSIDQSINHSFNQSVSHKIPACINKWSSDLLRCLLSLLNRLSRHLSKSLDHLLIQARILWLTDWTNDWLIDWLIDWLNFRPMCTHPCVLLINEHVILDQCLLCSIFLARNWPFISFHRLLKLPSKVTLDTSGVATDEGHDGWL